MNAPACCWIWLESTSYIIALAIPQQSKRRKEVYFSEHRMKDIEKKKKMKKQMYVDFSFGWVQYYSLVLHLPMFCTLFNSVFLLYSVSVEHGSTSLLSSRKRPRVVPPACKRGLFWNGSTITGLILKYTPSFLPFYRFYLLLIRATTLGTYTLICYMLHWLIFFWQSQNHPRSYSMYINFLVTFIFKEIIMTLV